MKYKELFLENIKNGNEGLIPVKGISMEPILYEGDVLIVRGQESYSIGDIVVFLYCHKDYIVHRIIDINKDTIYCQGDNAKSIEPIAKEQIIGKVNHVIKGRHHEN